MSLGDENAARRLLADPGRARAILIGASEFDGLQDLPAVAENLRELRRLLTDPAVWGLDDDACVVIGQKELVACDRGSAALDAIRSAVESDTHTLLVYYAGHGIVDPLDRKKLYLGMPDSVPDRLYKSLDYDDIRAELRRAKQANRIVILDCCFAERAFAGAMGSAPDIAGLATRADTPGTCVLAAASVNEEAIAPPGEKHTAFSGALIRLLKNGTHSGPELWDLTSLFKHLRDDLANQGHPLPRLIDRNLGSSLCLARNVAHALKPSVPDALTNLFRAQLRASEDFQYRLSGAHRAMIDVYVRQDLRGMHVSTANSQSAGTAAASALEPGLPRRIQEVLAEHRHFILIGGPGLGKSTQTVQLAAQLARPWLDNDRHAGGPPPPKLIPLRVIASVLASQSGSFEQSIVHAARAALGHAADSSLPEQLLGLAPKGSEWLILVDGIDEIADHRDRQKVLHHLGVRAKEIDSRYRFVISSRPLSSQELEALGPRTGRFLLQPFDLHRLTEFANRWFNDSDASANEFIEQVHKAHISELAQVPLLATIAAITYEAHPELPLPANRYGLYEQYISHLVAERAADANLQWQRLQDRLAVVSPREVAAAHSLFQRRMELAHYLGERAVEGKSDLDLAALAWIRRVSGVSVPITSAEWRELVATALNSTGLFTRSTSGLAFTHASLGEHLAAAAAARRLPKVFEAKAPKWQRVLDEAKRPFGDQSRAVLTHYAHQSGEGRALLDHLQSGNDIHNALLAGRLLAEGAPADDRHFRNFLNARKTMRSYDQGIPAWFSIAGRIPHVEIRAYLARATRHVSEESVFAAVALRESDPALAVQTLKRLIRLDQSSDADIRLTAAAALMGFGPDHAAEVVGYFLSDGHAESWRMALSVLDSLEQHQVDDALSIVRRLLSAPLREVRYAAAKTLVNADPSSFSEIIEGLSLDKDPLAWAQVDIGLRYLIPEYQPKAVNGLWRAIESSNKATRRTAAELLAGLHRMYVGQVLKLLLLDHDSNVRSSAAVLLFRKTHEYLADGVLELMLKIPACPEIEAALAGLGSPIVGRITSILEASSPQLWHDAAELVKACRSLRHDEWAIAILRGLATDSDPTVRGEAIFSMFAMGADHWKEAPELDSDVIDRAAAGILQLEPERAARVLCSLRASMNPEQFRQISTHLRLGKRQKGAAITRALVSIAESEGPAREAMEVLVDLAPKHASLPPPDDDLPDLLVQEALAEFEHLRSDEVDLGAERLAEVLVATDAATRRAVSGRLAAHGAFHASVVAMVFHHN
jgi:HEAT repeat protein